MLWLNVQSGVYKCQGSAIVIATKLCYKNSLPRVLLVGSFRSRDKRGPGKMDAGTNGSKVENYPIRILEVGRFRSRDKEMLRQKGSKHFRV